VWFYRLETPVVIDTCRDPVASRRVDELVQTAEPP
jgi:hypothetical protein